MGTLPAVTIVIPTLDRPQELVECLASLHQQTYQAYDLILLRERGDLAHLRNQGLARSTTPITCFIDDDVVLPPTWLATLLDTFHVRGPACVGVSGPAQIPTAYRKNRDLFHYRRLRWWYDRAFIGGERRPGHFTVSGATVPDPDWTYEGPVEYLEACNMAFRTKALQAVGGFDEVYQGIGDWSEPDLCFRLRKRYGNECLWYRPCCGLEHHPSRSGAFLLRRSDARQRFANYQLFAQRWVAPHWRHRIYRQFLTAYYLGWHSEWNPFTILSSLK